MRKKKDYKLIGAIALLVLVSGFALYSAGKAQEQGVLTVPIKFQIVSDAVDSFGAAIASVTHFTDVQVDNDLVVSETFTSSKNTVLSGTTTVQEITLGSRYSKALTFAGATTTPGGLFSIANTGSAKVCTTVIVNLTSGPVTGGPTGVGNAFAINVGTSTTATTWSAAGGSLMATTTVATTTTAGIYSNVVNAGSYYGADQDIGGAPWIWNNGVYLNGAVDDLTKSNDGSNYATSTGSLAGSVYVNCVTR